MGSPRSTAFQVAIVLAAFATGCEGERYPGGMDNRSAGRVPERVELDDAGSLAPLPPPPSPTLDSWAPPPARDMLERNETENAEPFDV